jgi:hypothetical protein
MACRFPRLSKEILPGNKSFKHGPRSMPRRLPVARGQQYNRSLPETDMARDEVRFYLTSRIVAVLTSTVFQYGKRSAPAI